MKTSPLRDLQSLYIKILMSLMAETLCFFPQVFLLATAELIVTNLYDFLSDVLDQVSLED